MTVPRWPLCVLALLATVVSTGAGRPQPTGADEPTVEWVQTSSDSVVEADTLDAMQAAQAEQPGSETDDGLPFAGVVLGDGFNTFGQRSFGDYTIKLVTSAGTNIDSYRDELQLMADQVNAYNGRSIVVAPGTIPPPANHQNMNAPVGEIWVIITTDSPCGILGGGSLGCGGVRSSVVIDGVTRWSSGAVWLSPDLSVACDEPVISHEIGHAMGLDHFNDTYHGVAQLMKSTTNCSVPVKYQDGDLNGFRWLAEPTPDNDNVASAALVCPGDSSVSANTWFATKETNEPAHAGADARRSVWYRYVPRPEQYGGTAIISTANDGVDDFDTELAVYTGTMFSSVTTVGSNNGAGLLSQVSFIIDSSQTYWIAVDGADLARGETDVVFDLPAIDGDLVPLCAPARVLDTRIGGATIDGNHQSTGRMLAGGTYQLPIAGRAGVPADADSVALNVTAVTPTSAGYVTVYPCGESPPNASNLNFSAGEVFPNLVLARVGAAQSVCFFSSAATDLLVDVSSYFPASDALVPLPVPGRLLDTRLAGATVDGAHQGVGPIAQDGTYELPVVNRAGVLPGATTVVLNVTAVGPSAGGFLTVFPCGEARPNASNLNYTAGDVIPNAVLARVGASGTVCLYSSAATDLLVDVSGYFPATTVLTPLAVPQRVLDTRGAGVTTDGGHQAVGVIPAGGTYQLPIAGRVGVPESAMSVVLNVTALLPNAAGFLTVFACGQDRPNASNLNYKAGEVIPNAVIASVGTSGKVCFYSSAQTHLLVDVSGYFPLPVP